MHASNRSFWQHCREKYNTYFSGANRVLEVGSFNIIGTVRDYFDKIETYIGVDWRPGLDVDEVVLAHDMNFPPFDTVISASMLEHDPYWDRSITNMIKHMKDDGILLLSWGAALNRPHCHDTAPDKIFHPLPSGKVLNLLADHNIYVHEFWYESNFVATGYITKNGEVVLVAFKDKKYASGESHIDELIEQDKV